MTAQIANDAAHPHLMLGDANAHHASWDSRAQPDTSGRALLEWAQQTGHTIVNTGDVTRRGNAARNQPDSSPDITMTRNATVSGWQTTPFLSSDHYAISFKVKWGDDSLEPPQSALDDKGIRDGRTMYAWKKANWEAFAADVEQALASSDPTTNTTAPGDRTTAHPKYRRVRVRQDLARLTVAIQRAAARHCPRGKRPSAEKLWSDTCEAAAEAAEIALATHHDAPTDDTNETFFNAMDTLRDTIYETSRQKFREKASTTTATDPNSWRLVRAQKAAPPAPPNATLVVKGKPCVSEKAQAQAFARYYSEVSKRSKHSSKPAPIPDEECRHIPAVTDEEFRAAVDALCTGKACGMDNIFAEQLRQLGPTAAALLKRIVAKSVLTGVVPKAWREGETVPLCKPNKDPSELASFRPVTLTSHIAKLCELIVKRRIQYDVKLEDSQSGFRAACSTADQILRVISEAKAAMDAGLAYAAILFDYSKAFDKIDHNVLLRKMLAMGIPPYLRRWVRSFLTNRTMKVRVGSRHSWPTPMTAGVPQGTILGPILFNIYMTDLAEELKALQPATTHGFYADDLTGAAIGKTASEVRPRLQQLVDIVNQWAKRNFMEINVDKTEAIVFARHDVAAKFGALDLKLGDAVIKMKDTVRLLGVMLDSRLTMKQHVDYIVQRANDRLAQLQVLCGATWGPRARDLRTFYMGYCCSVILYACQAWYSLLNGDLREKLESLHRRAARLISGAAHSARNNSVLIEARLLPIAVIVESRTAKYSEECSRLGGLRGRLATCQLLRPVRQHINDEVRTALAEPDPDAAGLMNRPKGNWRRPLRARPAAPWQTDFCSRVHINTKVEGATRKDPEEERRKCTLAQLKKLQPALFQLWSDGSVEESERRSGGAALLFRGKKLIATSLAPAGCMSTSCHAEGTAMHGGLFDLVKRLRRMKRRERGASWRLRICTDSQSLLAALRAGPLAIDNALQVEIWQLLRQLCDMVPRLHIDLQFVFAHCGVRRNEMADIFAARAATLPQSNAEVPIEAIVSSQTRAAKAKWASTVDPNEPRIVSVGTSAPAHNPEASREDERLLTQLRTNECPTLGRLFHRLTADTTTDCRWCCPNKLWEDRKARRKEEREQEKQNGGRKRRRGNSDAAAKTARTESAQGTAKAAGGEQQCPGCKKVFKMLSRHTPYCKAAPTASSTAPPPPAPAPVKRERFVQLQLTSTCKLQAPKPPVPATPTTTTPSAPSATAAAKPTPPQSHGIQKRTLPKQKCPKCHREFGGLTNHMRYCCPGLLAPREKTSSIAATTGTKVAETIHHVLFCCPALAEFRPEHLKLATKKGRRDAFFDCATAQFVRSALEWLEKRPEVQVSDDDSAACPANTAAPPATANPPTVKGDGTAASQRDPGASDGRKEDSSAEVRTQVGGGGSVRPRRQCGKRTREMTVDTARSDLGDRAAVKGEGEKGANGVNGSSPNGDQ
jgi:ribonuclease HI